MGGSRSGRILLGPSIDQIQASMLSVVSLEKKLTFCLSSTTVESRLIVAGDRLKAVLENLDDRRASAREDEGCIVIFNCLDQRYVILKLIMIATCGRP